jgi:hypothetical protein
MPSSVAHADTRQTQIKKSFRSRESIMNQNAMAEATLQDLLHDPIGQIMMDRDGVTVEEVLNLMEDMRHRLFEPMAADD